jgi:hypothetical protein
VTTAVVDDPIVELTADVIRELLLTASTPTQTGVQRLRGSLINLRNALIGATDSYK